MIDFSKNRETKSKVLYRVREKAFDLIQSQVEINATDPVWGRVYLPVRNLTWNFNQLLTESVLWDET